MPMLPLPTLFLVVADIGYAVLSDENGVTVWTVKSYLGVSMPHYEHFVC